MFNVFRKKALKSSVKKSLDLSKCLSFNFSKTYKVISPYTGETYTEATYKTVPEAQKIITEGYSKFREWRYTSLDDRIAVVKKSLEYFDKNKDTIAKDITCQMGKPLKESLEELKSLNNIAETLCKIAPQALAEKVTKTSNRMVTKYIREPMGISLIICPWNFPASTAASGVFTSVLAGNGVCLKHSPYTPLLGKHFQDAFIHAGAPHLVNNLMMNPDDLKQIFPLPEIGFVHFTGSSEVGHIVQEEVGDTRFINVGLELGGNDAAYVAEDADLDEAVKQLIAGALYNGGQCCNSVERIYVHESRYEEFLNKALAEIEEYKLGDPLLAQTKLGPLCLPEKPQELTAFVENAVSQNAKILCGGQATTDPSGKGRFFMPTIIADAQNDMDIMMKEIFGPLVGVASTVDDEEAIKLINDSQYGLTASIFSKDIERVNKIASKLKVGTVYGNCWGNMDPTLPWSGRKNSGKGVTLSELGFHQVTFTKSFKIKTNQS